MVCGVLGVTQSNGEKEILRRFKKLLCSYLRQWTESFLKTHKKSFSRKNFKSAIKAGTIAIFSGLVRFFKKNCNMHSRLLCETWILPNESADRYRKCLKNILLHLCGIFRHWWVFWNSNCQTLVYFFIQLNEKYKSFISMKLHLYFLSWFDSQSLRIKSKRKIQV